MKKVKVNIKEKSYDIVIGHNILNKLGAQVKTLGLGTDAVIITNSIVKRLHGKVLEVGLKKAGIRSKFFTVPDGEKSKAASVACDLVEKVAGYSADKKIFIIAFGGGVIGDLAGFVASSYKRGVPYIQVPTTLLAQVDSSIGGKVGVDLPCGKNLMGAFYQPKIVWMDVNVLKTLSKRQIRNGMAEIIKYGVIADKRLFEYVEQNYIKFIQGDVNVMTKIVADCSAIKARVVSKDEYDVTGIRAILNYGHTVGHAVEAAVEYDEYQHGEAIALGMRVAGEIAVHLDKLKQKEADRIETLISNVGLPEKIEYVKLPAILKTMKHDKKFVGSKNRFVLANKIGKVYLEMGIDLNIIKAAIKKYF